MQHRLVLLVFLLWFLPLTAQAETTFYFGPGILIPERFAAKTPESSVPNNFLIQVGFHIKFPFGGSSFLEPFLNFNVIPSAHNKEYSRNDWMLILPYGFPIGGQMDLLIGTGFYFQRVTLNSPGGLTLLPSTDFIGTSRMFVLHVGFAYRGSGVRVGFDTLTTELISKTGRTTHFMISLEFKLN